MPLLTRAFSTGARAFDLIHGVPVAGRAARFASALLRSCATNALTLAELRRGIREHWEVLVDLEGDAVEGLYEWEQRVVDRWTQPNSTILLAGCGSGRESLPLAARGCTVIGVDPAARALVVARRSLESRGLTGDFIDGFIEDVVVDGEFNAIWFGNASYSLIPEAARRVRTLRRLASQLRAGGFVCVNFQFPIHRPKAIIITASRLAGTLAGSDWRMEPGDRIGVRQRDGKAVYSYGHAFTKEEFEAEAAAAGLRIAEQDVWQDVAIYILQREPLAITNT